MCKDKLIRIIQIHDGYDSQETLKLIKEEHIGYHYDFLEDGTLLCYSDSFKAFRTATEAYTQTFQASFNDLETLSFLSEEIKEKCSIFMSNPLCPCCGVSLVDTPVSFMGSVYYAFNPTTKEFELKTVISERGNEIFCSECANEIDVKLPFDYQTVTFEKDENGNLSVKQEVRG